jgi:NADH-quinone oxidoreductase subunit A
MLELGLSFLIFGLLALVMISLNSLLGPKKPNLAREKPFECGSPYLQTDIPPVRIPFLLVALLFLLLDVEAVFLFPLALAFREHGATGLAAVGSYLLILALGFAYAWKKGIFDWS